MDHLEFVVTTKDNPVPRLIEFEEIYPQRDDIVTMTLLWDTNSYHVNVPRKQFIVNGGRKIHVKGFKGCEDLHLLHARRHTQKLHYNQIEGDGHGKPGEHAVSYLLGLEGTVDGEQKQWMLHVSPDGTLFRWLDKR